MHVGSDDQKLQRATRSTIHGAAKTGAWKSNRKGEIFKFNSKHQIFSSIYNHQFAT